MPDVVMPRLSDSMEEGTILKWLKSPGDEVAKGDELVEIETDKATMTYEADADGALEIVADEGSTLSIGEVIARIGEGAAAESSGDGGASEEGEQQAAAGDGGGDGASAPAATAERTEEEERAEGEGGDEEDEGGEEAAQAEGEGEGEGEATLAEGEGEAAQAEGEQAEGEAEQEGEARPDGEDRNGDAPEAEAERPPSSDEAPAARAEQQPSDEATSDAASAEPAPATAGNGGRPKASPVARRIAREHGIDLTALEGTGPGGRIVKADVEAAASGGAAAPEAGHAEAAAEPQAGVAEAEREPEAAEPETAEPEAAEPEADEPKADEAKAPAETGTAKGDLTTEEPSRIQQLIARRMAESKATIPHFTLSMDVDMEGAVELREQLKEVAQAHDSAVPSYNDMVVKACAIALRDFPLANASYRDGQFELHSRVNIGVAVAGSGTLIVPTIFDADHKGLGQIAQESRALAEKVRDGKISPPELSGGTFSITNLGMYGVTSFTAVINPPQSAILAVGKLEPKAVVHDGEVVARNTMNLTIACDHRILSGAPAAEFLGRIKAILERPVALAL